MTGSRSAYSVLGLEPGADRSAVEQAYRRLIKQHHPDRPGGDAARAAEINRAYRELRSLPERTAADSVHRRRPVRRPHRHYRRQRNRRHRRLIWSGALAAIAAILLLPSDRNLRWTLPNWTSAGLATTLPAQQGGSSGLVSEAAFDAQPSVPMIRSAVAEAERLSGSGDEDALALRSRNCHRALRARPGLAGLDWCAAFDSAVAGLGDRDPMFDSGTFSPSAVTARNMTAASLLSNDYLAIERRLNRIRTQVELIVNPRSPLPRIQPAPEPVSAERPLQR